MRRGITGLNVCLTVLYVSLTAAATLSAAPVRLYYDRAVPQAEFAAHEIELACQARNLPVTLHDLGTFKSPQGKCIVLADRSSVSVLDRLTKNRGAKLGDLQAEGFSLRVTGSGEQSVYWVIGADPAGTLYGGLELAEIVRTLGWGQVDDLDQNPYMAMRGTKFNIPLDVRTPSYTDVCDAAQKNIAEMWSFAFWKEYIDTLARYRYNFISCWNLHPFPSLVQVPAYPEVALADVQRSTVNWKEHYNLEGTGFDAPEILSNVEILKKMTIHDKIAFWRKVMAYGKSRNVDFYFITWNIFINGTEGKYGITDEVSNPITRDYFRQSVKQMFLTYPDLKGIGLTTGENMYGASFQEKENWAYDTYARGVLDVAREQPDRQITFVHRQHMAGALDIAEKFKPVIEQPNVEFIFSFKYAKAHVYSSTTQPYHPGFVRDIQGKGELKTIWTLRNDDVYYFRWGAPDFVRAFMQNIPHDVSRGYYYGSDQYIWGREFLMREPESPRQIEIAKHWYQWMMWGRLGYDPTVSNQRFRQILQARYPQVSGEKLFSAWQEASMIYPETTGFHWGALDFQWYIESSQSRPGPAQTASGFHDVNRFITLGPHKGTDNLSISDYVKQTLAQSPIQGRTPLQVARDIHAHADRALELLADLDHRGDKELRLTLDDIQTIAWLGKYYAHKIQAATALAFFRETLKPGHRDDAVENLQQSALYWRSYASLALSNHENPLWTNRVGHVDWRETYRYVIHDIRTLGGEIDIPSMPPSAGGTLLEAEDADHEGFEASSRIKGYTGSGYVTMDRHKGRRSVTWTCQAPVSGRYVLEFRYINDWGRETPLEVTVNGENAGSVSLWSSGPSESWVWDRLSVDLGQGDNRIRVQATGRIMMDHVNVLPANAGHEDPHGKDKVRKADVVVYGGTSAAVIAAVQVRKMSKSVIIVSPDKHLGGLSSGGLGWTDTGNKKVVGGLSREFYERIYRYYEPPAAWKWQERSAYRGEGSRTIDRKDGSMWMFEPHVAEHVFENLIAEHQIPVYRDEWLDREQGVQKEGNRIHTITTLSGRHYQGQVFIDATYEGDLMASAGVSYHIGREANRVYNERWNGVQVGVLHHGHHFGTMTISPYVRPGDPGSGLLPRISAEDPGRQGQGDHRVQAYCFRMCLSDHPDNRVPFTKPENYDPNQYDLFVRILDRGWDEVFEQFDILPNRKTDTNNHGPFNTDNIGMNYGYPDGTYEQRQAIIKEHETYQKGMMYFLAYDPRVPIDIRTRMRRWGYAQDEFVDNDHWPHQLYIREARRMIGTYVTTEHDVLGKRQPPQPIGMGSYTMDSHNVQRYITPEGYVQNEGDIGVSPRKPYHIAYGSIVPKKAECQNLLVPVCVSSSHIAFGSIRMEPVFMILGQSAATAACLAVDDHVSVQDVNYEKLRARLIADRQRL